MTAMANNHRVFLRHPIGRKIDLKRMLSTPNASTYFTQQSITDSVCRTIPLHSDRWCTVRVNKIPLMLSDIFPKRLAICSPNFTRLLNYAFLSTLDYNFLSNYLQLWRIYAMLSATTQRAFRPMVDIFCIWSMWTGWSRFVNVAGNWIKVRSLA